MATTRDDVFRAALDLPEEDRFLLVGELIPEDFPGWSIHDARSLDELDRRAGDGSMPIPWTQVREEIQPG